MNTVTLKIDGMHCDGCAARIEGLLRRAPGVREASVSFADGAGRITFSDGVTSAGAVNPTRLIEIVDKAGFTAEPA